MSDYLGELASRAVGAATLVQPRLASRFEPRHTELLEASAEADDRMLGEPAGPATEPEAVQAGDRPGRGADRHLRPAPVDGSADPPTSGRRPPLPDVPAQTSPSLASPTAAASGAGTRTAEDHQSARTTGKFPGRAAPRTDEPTAATAPPGAARGERAGAARSSRQVARPRERHALPGQVPDRSEDAAPRPARAEDTGSLTLGEATAAAGPSEETAGIARSQPAPTRRSAARLDMDRPAPDREEPVVKVTIGRVEVRAITPPKTPPSKRAVARSGPAISLDEYLKQRNEGRR
jgi:hypothetical protein